MSQLPAESRFVQLLAEIGSIYEKARRGLAEAYWNIGKRVVEIEQDGDIHAHYGEGLLQRVSDELRAKYGKGFSVGNIQNMRRFFLAYPKYQTSDKLTWSQYVELLPVADKRKRARLEERAKRQKMTAREVRVAAAKIGEGRGNEASEGKALPPLKRPVVLTFNTYKKVKPEILKLLSSPAAGAIFVDCGFYVYREVPETATGFEIAARPFYVYRAAVERVIDGDTLKVLIDVGFGATVRESLRLRGVNTPEVGTPEGEAAKKYVVRLLPPGTPIVIKSHRSDLHGRFVADVFLTTTPPGGEVVYLNQELLDKGLAVRVAE